MSTPPAGWFPDPDGQDRLRYWDGTAWTEHYATGGQAPGAAPGAFGSAPSGGAAPGGYGPIGGYGTSPSQGGAYGTSPTTPYGAAPSQPGAGSGYGSAPAPGWADTAGTAYGIGGTDQQSQQGYGGYGATPAYASPGGPSGPGGPGGPGTNRGLVITLVAIGAVIVIVLAVLGIRLLTAGGGDPTTQPTLPTQQPTTEPTDSPTTDQPTDEPTTDAPAEGELALESTLQASLSSNGQFEATITFPEDGLYVIAAESDGDDTTLTLLDDHGDRIAFNDDHPDAADSLFAGSFDALLTGYWPAGDYTVVLEEYSGTATTVTLSASHVAEAVEIPTETASFSVPEQSAWFGWVTIEDGEAVDIDVRTTTDGDLRISIVSPDGEEVAYNDDRDSGPDTGESFDPFVTVEGQPAGRYIVIIGDYDGAAGDATIVATHR